MPATSASPLFISSKVAARVFQWREAVAALQDAYRNMAPDAALPSRSIAVDRDGWLRTLPAMPNGCEHFGAKLMGITLTAAHPAVEYVIVLFSRETSRIAAFIDGAQITAYRTAATSAAAVDKMAPSDPARLAVLGSGLEAAMHTRAIAAVRPLRQITIFSPTAAHCEQFARTIAEELGVPTRAVQSPREATENADIVLAAARSHGERPILYGDWILPGAIAISIGSTVPHQREIDVSVIGRASLIVCDRPKEVMTETGDMIAAIQAGLDVAARCRSLSELMAGKVAIAQGTTDIALFKSVGSGLQDIVVADLILSKAKRAGLAVPLPIEFESKWV